MKKLMACALAVLLLAGCSQTTTYTTKVTDGDTSVATVGNANITKQDLYECLMDASGLDYVLNDVLTQIASTATIDEEALNTEVESTETTWKAILGDNLDSYVQSYFGYDTFEDYKTSVLIPSTREMLMIKGYASDNFETLAKSYSFVQCRLLIVSDQETALTALSELTSEEITFAEAVEKYSTDSTNISNKGEIGLVSDLSTCTADENIITILPQLTKIGLYSVPIELSTGSYGVLEVVETDQEVLKDSILAELQEADEVYYEAEAYFLEENGFTIEDSYFKSLMETTYPEYVK